jgi:hypothetical protein
MVQTAVCCGIGTKLSTQSGHLMDFLILYLCYNQAFFLGGRRGTHTPKHFVNLTGESKNFKMLGFPLKKLKMFSIDCFYFFRFEL